ncbi:hypothetical protein JK636_01805 [Clostridium sp. YIM B02515]|uniref:Uncharacterized protein n=1 Tax=Clostridium rhizosphaerae TaxID=2803861 RepID=A0ABS1T815_9CLOT|nr:hypothetical protein [Clostridium rhizosphaerae]MBL4934489.1 hypothetical protein [Clostridium rhizosphaerae]
MKKLIVLFARNIVVVIINCSIKVKRSNEADNELAETYNPIDFDDAMYHWYALSRIVL